MAARLPDKSLTLIVAARAADLRDQLRRPDGNASGALLRVLAQADAHPAPVRVNHEAMLFDAFGVQRRSGSDLPVAAVTRLADGIEDEAPAWLRADPVHLAADPAGLVLVEAPGIALAPDHAHALVEEIIAGLGADAPRLLLGSHPERWYIALSQPPALITCPPLQALGRRLQDCAPSGADSGKWLRYGNDVQMLLHGAAANQARTRKGLPPVNSLWLWGGGAAPEPPGAGWSSVYVYGDDPLAVGLARLTGVPVRPCPASVADLLKHGRPSDRGGTLVVFAPDAIREEDFALRLERNWLGPILERLRAGQLGSVTLALLGEQYVLRGSRLWRWWRRFRRIR
jgi:hypothetical protein